MSICTDIIVKSINVKYVKVMTALLLTIFVSTYTRKTLHRL